jgi:hypothetical protein
VSSLTLPNPPFPAGKKEEGEYNKNKITTQHNVGDLSKLGWGVGGAITTFYCSTAQGGARALSRYAAEWHSANLDRDNLILKTIVL